MIVSIEGIDGAGKNTLVSALRATTGAEVMGFPRYDDHVEAQLARRALYQQMGDLNDSVHGMATLFALDRFRARDELAEFAPGGRRATDLLILDRYVASNAAYSVARTGDGAVADWVADLEFGLLGLPVPTLQILLATDVGLAAARATIRAAGDDTRATDVYERDGQLQADTAAAYRRLAESQWCSEWLVVEPGAEAPERVAAVVARRLGELAPCLSEKNGGGAV